MSLDYSRDQWAEQKCPKCGNVVARIEVRVEALSERAARRVMDDLTPINDGVVQPECPSCEGPLP